MFILLYYITNVHIMVASVMTITSVYSLKKLKSKEERKLRRKRQRAAKSVTQEEMKNLEIEDKTEEGADKGVEQSKGTLLIFRLLSFSMQSVNIGSTNLQQF